ncbi:MAG: hypothetical protein L3J54_14075, partial [Draconibacterium sp.]|nr:hypothetical protein [Draconibacterium sp.]
MKLRRLFLLLIILSFTGTISAQNWKNIRTIEDVYTAYPKEIETMLNQFNLDTEGMEKVKQAFNSGNTVEACTQLLEYYKNGNTAQFLRQVQPVKTAKTESLADTILKNVFVVQNVRGEVPVGKDGHRNWYSKGRNNDGEWA